jgi:hypothetical protein
MLSDFPNGVNGTTHLQPIHPTVPLHWGSEVSAGYVDTIMASEALLVTGKHHLVFSGRFDTHSIV